MALLLALVVVGTLLATPGGDWVARASGLSWQELQPIRKLFYATSSQALRDPSRLGRALAAAPAGHTTAVVLGSSEFSSQVPQNPSRFLPGRVSDADLFEIGRGYTQSLVHASQLPAIADSIPNRRVTLIVSPQWFTAQGATPDSFREVFSAAHHQALLTDRRLRPETRAVLLERVLTLADPLWSRQGSPTRPLDVLTAVPDAATRRMLTLKSLNEGARALAPYEQPWDGPTDLVRSTEIDWEAELLAAERDGRATVTNNQFQIADQYFDQYIKSKLATLKGSLARTDFGADSPEWGDLQLFLRVARDLDLRVQIVVVPMNGWWYDYAGYDASRRSGYYDRLRRVAAEAGAEVADFSGSEYEPYFLYDVMHLGWKGWLHVTRACVDFQRS